MSTSSEATPEHERLSEAKDKALAELGIFLANEIGGRPGDDWFTYHELYAKVLERVPDTPDAKFRYRLDKLVREGVFEKHIVSNKEVYYRKL